MTWLFNIRETFSLEERYRWIPVRILYETQKAILVDVGKKAWIPKSWIHGVRLRNNLFEIYIGQSAIG